MSKHNFVESQEHGDEWQVIIYCTWCGKVAWHFNKTNWSVDHLQPLIREACIPQDEGNE